MYFMMNCQCNTIFTFTKEFDNHSGGDIMQTQIGGGGSKQALPSHPPPPKEREREKENKEKEKRR